MKEIDFTDNDLIKNITEDSNTLDVGTISTIFITTIKALPHTCQSYQRIIDVVGEDEYYLLMGSLMMSFLCSMYVTASKNPQELNERIKEVEATVGKDIKATNLCSGKADNA